MSPGQHRIMAHGGDLKAAAARYGIAAEDWLDLSTGINPLAYPLPVIGESAWTRLPQSGEEDALLAAARTAYDVPDHLAIVAVPGTQAAIQWLPRLAERDGPVAIPSRTYSEHGRAWQQAGFAVEHDKVTDKGHAVLVNPDNPDGSVRSPRSILERRRSESATGLLVVDEAFADCDPETSVAPHVGNETVAILRSFGKFYGLAGLRLGFVIAQKPLAARLREAIGPWAVSGPALAIGRLALMDRAWTAATREALFTDSHRMDELLAEHGLDATGMVPLFRLVRDERALAIHDALARQGIWTRIFDYEPGWIRFGVPRTPEDRDRLDRALRSL